MSRLIALPCKIIRGVVSDERAFEIAIVDDSSHPGVAPVHYFWDDHGGRIADDVPTRDDEIIGKVAARLLERSKGTAIVSIPDGSVVPVKADHIAPRPSEVVFDASNSQVAPIPYNIARI